jgi:hypothetical protein
MSLTRASVDTILHYLEPHLDTLQTGFPTSTRPNEPTLTVDQKRQKIESTLLNDPGVFLTKWGSVILYPRPTLSTNDSKTDKETCTPKDILDLFVPLECKLFFNFIRCNDEKKHRIYEHID